MTADYGLRQAAKGQPWLLIFVGLAAVMMVGVVFASHSSHVTRQVAEFKAYQLGGRPCPEVTKAAFEDQTVKAEQVFGYDNMVFARAFGHAECTELAAEGGRGWTTYPACRFTAPGVVKSTSATGEAHYYVTGPGHGVVLSFPHGQTLCEVGERVGAISG
jgi:hypothetical protein